MWYPLMQINIYLHLLFCFVEARINILIFSSPFVCPLVCLSGYVVANNCFYFGLPATREDKMVGW